MRTISNGRWLSLRIEIVEQSSESQRIAAADDDVPHLVCSLMYSIAPPPSTYAASECLRPLERVQ
jgi:hypothetical protein